MLLAKLLLPRSCKCNPLEFRLDFLLLLLSIKSRFCKYADENVLSPWGLDLEEVKENRNQDLLRLSIF